MSRGPVWIAVRCATCNVRLPLAPSAGFRGFSAEAASALARFHEQHPAQGRGGQGCRVEACSMKWAEGQQPLRGSASPLELLRVCRQELPGLRICGRPVEGEGDRCPEHPEEGAGAVEESGAV